MVVKEQEKIPHIKEQELNIDLEVVLLPAHYIPTRSYPVWGSEYSCIGTIVGIQRDAGLPGKRKVTLVRIDWSSGADGLYSYDTVALASNANTNDPNIGYKMFKKGAR